MVNAPLWQKPGVEIDESAMRFMAGQDVVLDRELLAHDIRATCAHVRALASRGLIGVSDRDAMLGVLKELAEAFETGRFVLDDRYEDGHSAIEAWLTERLGETGARVHLGRSRNDQVLTALRLYMRESLAGARRMLVEGGQAALARAREHERAPMPGYTHLQRAVPSSVGLWMGSFAEELAIDAELCADAERWLDRCPLGTAAGYGVNLALAREEVATELGFSALAINPMAAQASRGKAEAHVVSVLWQAMQTVRRLAWDLSLFSSAEFGFVALPPFAITGSSIMPNKRNPDLAELLRTSAATVGGCLSELLQVTSLPSGYHRDLQATKAPLVRAVRVARESLGLVPALLAGLEFDADRMRSAIEPAMLATDRAVELAATGVAFREAYRRVAGSLEGIEPGDAGASVEARVSPGACADLRLDEIGARLERMRPGSA